MTSADLFAVPDPMSAPPLRWGVIGAGKIARTFVDAVNTHTAGEVVAIGSRSASRAEAFAAGCGVPGAHGSYDALVADPGVQAVYVASPHSEHRAHALLAVGAGIPVLVEKAFTRNEREAREVFDAAAGAGVFVMEAMWTAFLPHVVAVRRLVADGAVGEVVSLTADHGQYFDVDPASRLFAPELAGGALLDLGVYPVSFAHALLGAPERTSVVGTRTATGVDATVDLTLSYPGGAQAALHTTLRGRTATVASIAGTEGRIDIDGDFYRPTGFTLTRRDGTHLRHERAVPGGFQYQVAEVARCVAAGATTSSVMTPGVSIAVMAVLDEARRAVGVVYPGE